MKEEDKVKQQFQLNTLDQTKAVHLTKEFNNVTEKRLTELLKELLFLLNKYNYSREESTVMFINTSKLYKNNSVKTRQIIYLIFNILCSNSNDTLVIISSIMKDVNSKQFYSSNAMTCLFKALEPSLLLTSMDKQLKQILISNDSTLVSSTLLSLLDVPIDYARKYKTEIHNCYTTYTNITQYHSLLLLTHLFSSDTMFMLKLTSINNSSQHYMTSLQLLHILYTLYTTTHDTDITTKLYSYIRHRNDIISLEAVKYMTLITTNSDIYLHSIVSVLEQFLLNTSTVYKYSALRLLYTLSSTHPILISQLNSTVEECIDEYPFYSLHILLATGYDTTLLLNKLSTLTLTITQKLLFIQQLPYSPTTTYKYLSNLLREDTTEDIKLQILHTCINLSTDNNLHECLSTLCEYIEDCEYTQLTLMVLHYISTHLPLLQPPHQPLHYLRYIYNRIVLENSIIRSECISTLYQLALTLPTLFTTPVVELLQDCIYDSDCIVRDTSQLYLYSLLHSTSAVDINPVAFELALNAFIESGNTDTDEFDFNTISHYVDSTVVIADTPVDANPNTIISNTTISNTTISNTTISNTIISNTTIAKTFDFSVVSGPSNTELGNVISNTNPKPIQLTETGTEFTVTVNKYIYSKYILFEFSIHNTLDYSINCVYPLLSHSSPTLSLVSTLPIPVLNSNSTKTTLVLYSYTHLNTVEFTCTLCYNSDEYAIDTFTLTVSDYVLPVTTNDFNTIFNTKSVERLESYNLSAFSTVDECVECLLVEFGMCCISRPVGISGTLCMSGTLCGECVLVRVRMVQSTDGVGVEVCVRGDVVEYVEFIASVMEG